MPEGPWTHESESYRFATRQDIPAIASMLADPEVGRWLWFTPLPEEAAEGYFAPLLDAQHEELRAGRVPHTAVFVVEGAEGEFLGQGAVVAIEGSPGGFEIGFQLCQSAWGRGVGTRLGWFLCAYAVERCRAYRIEGSCLEGNGASAALLQKLGLEREGRKVGFRLKEQTRHTELLFGREVSSLSRARIREVAEARGLVESGQ